MTIKGLSKFIKDKSPDYEEIIPLSELSGSKIAVDAHNWMYRSLATASSHNINKTDVTQKEVDREVIMRDWYISTIEFINVMLFHNILPVFVFDGEARKTKDDTRDKRREQKEKTKAKIEELNKVITDNPLETTTDQIEEMRKLMRSLTVLKEGEMDALQDILKSCGLPVLTAIHDAEELCSMLAIEGKVSAVFSSDSDCLALGCPLMLKGMVNRFSVKGVRLKTVLTKLGMNYSFFSELCILSGCDFNKNIKGIGIGKGYKLLQQYNKIENIPIMDQEKLNQLELDICRSIFCYKMSKKCIRDGSLDHDVELLIKMGREVLTRYNVEHKYNDLYSNLMKFNKTKPDIFQSPYSCEIVIKDE